MKIKSDFSAAGVEKFPMRDAEEIPHIVKPLRSSHVHAEFCICCAEFRMVDAEI